MNGAVSKANKKFISHLTRAQRTPSAAATVQVSHALPAVRFSCLLRGPGVSFQDGVAPGKGFLCAPFWGVQICDYSAAHCLEKTRHAWYGFSKPCTVLHCNHRSGHLKTEHTGRLFLLRRHLGNWPRIPAVSMRSEVLVAHEKPFFCVCPVIVSFHLIIFFLLRLPVEGGRRWADCCNILPDAISNWLRCWMVFILFWKLGWKG